LELGIEDALAALIGGHSLEQSAVGRQQGVDTASARQAGVDVAILDPRAARAQAREPVAERGRVPAKIRIDAGAEQVAVDRACVVPGVHHEGIERVICELLAER
jgi:hypothetical protein